MAWVMTPVWDPSADPESASIGRGGGKTGGVGGGRGKGKKGKGKGQHQGGGFGKGNGLPARDEPPKGFMRRVQWTKCRTLGCVGAWFQAVASARACEWENPYFHNVFVPCSHISNGNCPYTCIDSYRARGAVLAYQTKHLRSGPRPTTEGFKCKTGVPGG